MIQNRRTWLIVLIIAVAVVLIFVIVSVLKFVGSDGDSAGELNPESTPFGEERGGKAVPVVPPKDPDQQAAESMARSFIERMGSYSTQSDFQNIDDLMGVMTPRVQEWAESLKTDIDSGTYRGLTTRALSLELLEYEPQKSAVVRVDSQRQEESENGEGRVYYQDAEVHLVHDGSWMVDGPF